MENKTIAEMRHEVIDNTIRLELMLEDIIQTNMGFEMDLQEEENEDGESEVVIGNEKGIKKFRKFFLDKINLDRKFEIIKTIIKEDSKNSVPTNIWEYAKRVKEIRNIFAHTLAPKYPERPRTLKMEALDYDCPIKNVEDWKKLYEEHTKSFNFVYETISKLFYIKIDTKELESFSSKEE